MIAEPFTSDQLIVLLKAEMSLLNIVKDIDYARMVFYQAIVDVIRQRDGIAKELAETKNELEIAKEILKQKYTPTNPYEMGELAADVAEQIKNRK